MGAPRWPDALVWSSAMTLATLEAAAASQAGSTSQLHSCLDDCALLARQPLAQLSHLAGRDE